MDPYTFVLKKQEAGQTLTAEDEIILQKNQLKQQIDKMHNIINTYNQEIESLQSELNKLQRQKNHLSNTLKSEYGVIIYNSKPIFRKTKTIKEMINIKDQYTSQDTKLEIKNLQDYMQENFNKPVFRKFFKTQHKLFNINQTIIDKTNQINNRRIQIQQLMNQIPTMLKQIEELKQNQRDVKQTEMFQDLHKSRIHLENLVTLIKKSIINKGTKIT